MNGIALVVLVILLAGCTRFDPPGERFDRRFVTLVAVQEASEFVDVSTSELERSEFQPLAQAFRSSERSAITSGDALVALDEAIDAKWTERYGRDAPWPAVLRIEGDLYEMHTIS